MNNRSISGENRNPFENEVVAVCLVSWLFWFRKALPLGMAAFRRIRAFVCAFFAATLYHLGTEVEDGEGPRTAETTSVGIRRVRHLFFSQG